LSLSFLEPWHVWVLSACAIAAVELLLLNSYYLLALVAGSLITGVTALVADLSMAEQWAIFAIATAVAAVLMRKFRTQSENKDIDNISHMIGARVEVVETISPRGRAKYKGVTWAAESEDLLEAGESARIINVNGSTLYVEKIKENN